MGLLKIRIHQIKVKPQTSIVLLSMKYKNNVISVAEERVKFHLYKTLKVQMILLLKCVFKKDFFKRVGS